MDPSSASPSARHDETTPLLPQNFHDDQSKSLPRKQLLVVIPVLSFVHFISFLDQMIISTSLPAIAAALSSGAFTSWVGTSFLVTSTSVQLLNGRLSDIFGRKTCLITALTVMSIGNLLCGFSRAHWQLCASRALTGFGAGALNTLVQVTISDLTRLHQRGYYFGTLGVAVALGNGLGPVVVGILVEKAGWRWAFWFICPLTFGAIALLALVLSESPSTRDFRGTFKMIDWLGVRESMLGIIALLIVITEAGWYHAWNFGMVVTFSTLATYNFLTFIDVECRKAQFPILPMRLFHHKLSTNILLATNFLIGWVFWGNMFYLPMYFQNVRGLSPSTSGSLILPMVITYGITSGVSGVLISLTGCYKSVISGGAALWAIGAILKSTYGTTTPFRLCLVTGILEGIGIGCSLQPVLFGLLAGTNNSDRALITGLCNFIRDMGGCIGIAVSGAILTNILHSGLKERFSWGVISQLTSFTFFLSNSCLPSSDDDKSLIIGVYARGLHAVFISFAVLTGIMLVACLCLRDYGLKIKRTIQP